MPSLSPLIAALHVASAGATWIQDHQYFRNENGPRVFVADTTKTGKITTLSWKGRNILGFESGSFRPATQAMWNNGAGWPPPPAWVDSAFRPKLLSSNSILMLEGPVGERSLQPVRRMRFDPSDSAFVTDYVVRNTAWNGSNKIAAWEIIRLPGGALQFFPKGQELTGLANTLVPNLEDSMVWVKDDGSQNQKLLYRDDKEGWMAAVVDSILLVKTWKDVPLSQIPPGQGEVQVYLQQNPAFGEMECMGPWTTLAPRDSLTWTVRWYLAPIPAGVSKSVGSPDLIKLARKAMGATTRILPRNADPAAGKHPLFDASGRSRLPDPIRTVNPQVLFEAH